MLVQVGELDFYSHIWQVVKVKVSVISQHFILANSFITLQTPISVLLLLLWLVLKKSIESY